MIKYLLITSTCSLKLEKPLQITFVVLPLLLCENDIAPSSYVLSDIEMVPGKWLGFANISDVDIQAHPHVR